jgi:heme-degrading monooxygenase HmoA
VLPGLSRSRGPQAEECQNDQPQEAGPATDYECRLLADMIVTVFRSRLRADAYDNGYAETAEHLESKAQSMPGFVSFKTFVAEDGERVSIVEFEDWASHDAWRDDPEHRHGQKLGRSDFYAEYAISVCERVRHRTFES